MPLEESLGCALCRADLGIYLLLTTVPPWLGFRHLLRLSNGAASSHFRFSCPGIFGIRRDHEEVSLVGFLIQRLDLILVLNLGGIALLGSM